MVYKIRTSDGILRVNLLRQTELLPTPGWERCLSTLEALLSPPRRYKVSDFRVAEGAVMAISMLVNAILVSAQTFPGQLLSDKADRAGKADNQGDRRE